MRMGHLLDQVGTQLSGKTGAIGMKKGFAALVYAWQAKQTDVRRQVDVHYPSE
jgi:hypothetical protein